MNIIIGISGGIAAYKIPQLVRLLKKNGHEVQCVATTHALQFVTALTLETVSGRQVYCDLFATVNRNKTEHIALKDWADIIVVAPATANIIGKMANGIADDALSTLLLSMSKKPRYVCPSMNSDMLHANATQRNIEILRNDGVNIIESTYGELACGISGDGRMPEPEEIYKLLIPCEINSLYGKQFLVTAGPTYERIDAVRFIGNYSSGKMGFAIAEELAKRGGHVNLITGPTIMESRHHNINCIHIESAREMCDYATKLFPECDGAILTAAVADFRPSEQQEGKMKKNGDEGLTLHLVQNPDILKTLGLMKKNGQLLAGFALETDNEISNAVEKLEKKNLDFIVLNSLRDKGAGFGVDTNIITIIRRDGSSQKGILKTKKEIAKDVVDEIERHMALK